MLASTMSAIRTMTPKCMLCLSLVAVATQPARVRIHRADSAVFFAASLAVGEEFSEAGLQRFKPENGPVEILNGDCRIDVVILVFTANLTFLLEGV